MVRQAGEAKTDSPSAQVERLELEVDLLRGGYFQLKRTSQKLQKAEEELREYAETLEKTVAELRTTTVSRDELATEVVQRKRAEESAKRSADENALLYSTVMFASQTEEFEEALQQCLDLVCEYVEWPVGHLYVPAPSGTGELAPTSVWHLDDPKAFQTFRDVTERTTFMPGVGLPGRVLSSGEPAWIKDVQKDDNFPRNRAARDIGVRGAFGFPVKIGTETVAVLEFFTSESVDASPQLLEIMRIIGLQVGRLFERKRAERSLQTSNIALASTNAELEAFSYSVAHDLRAPLRAMDGFSKMLADDYPDDLDDQGKHYVHRVRAAAQRMGELIDNLLGLSQVTRREMNRTTVDLSSVAQSVAADLREMDGERKVDFAIKPGLTARGDPHLLRILLENLFGNAWKFTGHHPKAKIELGSSQDNGVPAFFVRDDGAGFDMAYADRLFGAFKRLHPEEEFEGTGIGLATVQRIARRHGGRVWAEGKPQQGATFYFTLQVE